MNVEPRDAGRRDLGATDEDLSHFHSQTRCAICGREFGGPVKKCYDHSHTSNRYRGALCVQCNSGLGCFRDDINLLFDAIAYLDAQLDTEASCADRRKRSAARLDKKRRCWPTYSKNRANP